MIHPKACFLLAVLGTVSALAEPLVFSGDFAPVNWTFSTAGDGFVNTGGAPASIFLAGSDSGLGTPILTSYNLTYVGVAPITITFQWAYTTEDEEARWDPFGYMLNAALVQLTNDSLRGQVGFTMVTLQPGDAFGFWIDSSDDLFGRASATIGGSEVPEPVSGILVGFVIAGASLALRRSRAL